MAGVGLVGGLVETSVVAVLAVSLQGGWVEFAALVMAVPEDEELDLRMQDTVFPGSLDWSAEVQVQAPNG